MSSYWLQTINSFGVCIHGRHGLTDYFFPTAFLYPGHFQLGQKSLWHECHGIALVPPALQDDADSTVLQCLFYAVFENSLPILNILRIFPRLEHPLCGPGGWRGAWPAPPVVKFPRRLWKDCLPSSSYRRRLALPKTRSCSEQALR